MLTQPAKVADIEVTTAAGNLAGVIRDSCLQHGIGRPASSTSALEGRLISWHARERPP